MDGTLHDRHVVSTRRPEPLRATPAEVELAVLDADGVIVAVNGAWDRFCRTNGGDPDGAGPGRSYLAICDAAGDESSVRVAAAIRTAIAGDLPAPQQLTVPCHGPGEQRMFDVLVSSRFGDDGAIAGATVTFSRRPAPRDEPVRADGGLDPAPHLAAMAALAEATPDGLMIVDQSGLMVLVNGELAALSGYRVEDLTGRSVSLLMPVTARLRHQALLAGFQGGPRSRTLGEDRSLSLRRRDGSLLPVEVLLRPTVIDGQTVVVATVRDVQVQGVLQEDARMVTQALDAVSEGVVILDAGTGRCLYANAVVRQRTGRSAEELDQLPAGTPASEQDRERIRRAIQDVVAGRARERALPAQVVSKDGTAVAVELRISYRAAAEGTSGAGQVILVSRASSAVGRPQ